MQVCCTDDHTHGGPCCQHPEVYVRGLFPIVKVQSASATKTVRVSHEALVQWLGFHGFEVDSVSTGAGLAADELEIHLSRREQP